MIAAADVGGMLNYEYYSSGLLKKVTMNDQWLSKMKYNLQGNQTELEERNASITKYTYNNFGELTEQTDANGNTKEMSYDVLGRIIRKTGTGTSNTQNNYYYVPSGNGINQLQSVLETNTNTKEEYTYDYLGRVERLKETVDNTVFTTKYSYNALSNLATTTYPSGANIKNTYNNLGFLKIVSHNGDMVWQGGAMNNFGQYTNIKKGDGISTYKKYDQYGFPTHFLANNPHIQDLQMEFNAQNGNLLWRSDITTNNLFEEFGYDNANRLKTTMINGQQPYDMEYLDNGNIEDDTQAGAYTYDPDKLNAVVGVTNPNNPPHISLMLQDVTYNNFNSPATIEEGTDHLELIYGPDEQRIKTVLSNNTGITATTYFLGNYELIKAANGDRTQLHYIAGGDGLAAILKIDPQGDEEMYYTYTDHLGSILTLTDKNRDIVLRQNGVYPERSRGNAWGRERDPYFWKYSLDYNVGTQHGFEWLNRGFTGHEHLTRFQLINMNGRVYDPMVKRMLSVDNFVQDVTSTQGYNRYSYALNNPLKYTDPDGELVDIAGFLGERLGGGSSAPSGHTRGTISSNRNAINQAAQSYIQTAAMTQGILFGIATGGLIATSGVPFAGTLAIAAGSLGSSLIGNTYYGGDISIGFGAGSYNFSAREFGYLGKEGNSWQQNLGYGLGALVNISDGVGLFDQIRANQRMNLTDAKKQANYDANFKEGYYDEFVGPNGNADPVVARANGHVPETRLGEAAYQHDVSYYNQGADGVRGAVFNTKTVAADRTLLSSAKAIRQAYRSGSSDVLLKTHRMAFKVRAAFVPLVGFKYALSNGYLFTPLTITR